MGESSKAMGHVDRLTQPLHIQRLERSLSLQPFLNYVEKVFEGSNSDDSADETFQQEAGKRSINGLSSTREERRSDKLRLFNFDSIRGERGKLRDVLVSDSSDDSLDDDRPISEDRFQEMLRQHVTEKKIRRKFYGNPSNALYQYYGTGLLSNYDKFPEHQDSLGGISKKKVTKKDPKLEPSKKKGKKLLKKENSFNESIDQDDYDGEDRLGDDFDDEETKFKPSGRGVRGRRKQDKNKSPEIMAIRRRKLWATMAKKELGKCQRVRTNNHKEVITACKKVAQLCIKHWKQKALQSQKNMKEVVWRNKRLAREMQAYWKRYERVERDVRRRQEKEAEEQRKMDVEFMEAKRQQRKLNFLITQTELYAHFISKKISGGLVGTETQRILSQLDEAPPSRLSVVDNYNSEDMKSKATRNVEHAVNAEMMRSRAFELSSPVPSTKAPDERPQPSMFRGTLKHYQLKGMNWLANLYDQGINGILADEMGLGKTVQSVAFLCHIAEKYSVWGPFLIISPASTLHNWQQEMERFVPDFKVVPYWGNVQDRRVLRQFWEQKGLHTKDASFHVVITSYQLVISDFKYFNRIKWQYLILDEAQAIKSSNSMRWKLLLGFSCRNRLLLSGTPIQNSMAELWALLHFIMPTLFDNHDEFSEWFSKDIEGQAENKSRIDEKHLSRLHLILKPFMLRRIKKDVENELSDKIEIMVYCPLTTRQKLLYSGLKQKIRVEDLLAGISGRGGTSDDPNKNVASNLMNLVMQFRKVCNHPELFERREARSPFCNRTEDYSVPKLVYQDAFIFRAIPSIRHITHNSLSISTTEHIARNLDGAFSFLRLIGLSAQEAHVLLTKEILHLCLSLERWRHQMDTLQHRTMWEGQESNTSLLLIANRNSLMPPNSERSPILDYLIFTRMVGRRSRVYTHTKHIHHSMAETLEHRIMRSRKMRVCAQTPSPVKLEHIRSPEMDEPRVGRRTKSNKLAPKPSDEAEESYIVPEFPFVERPPRILECQPTEFPPFLYHPCMKVQSRSRAIYSSCCTCVWETLKHDYCGTPEGLDTVWYGHPTLAEMHRFRSRYFQPAPSGGLHAAVPDFGWSNIVIPDKQTLVADAGKLYVLDGLLKRLKEGGHRVLIYSQMTRMIDLLEEYMWHRKHTYKRLDGSSKISERRDMVADFQSRADIFVFLLSTRAGGLGINLTAADTVIFYDSDWNPTVDQQAMDRAHRLGQTKQVTVYRLICKGTIEERILQRAREKSEIQRMVISGGNFKPDHLKPKEVVSLLLDDEEIEKKYNQKQAEKRLSDDLKTDVTEKKMKIKDASSDSPSKTSRGEAAEEGPESASQSPSRSEKSTLHDDTSNDGLVVDVDSPVPFAALGSQLNPLGIGSVRVRPVVRGSRRGRPRGVRRGASNAVRKRAYDSDIKLPGEMFLSGESPSTSSELKRGAPVKRGPGRPRMKPYIPGARGTRGQRPRRAHAPLQVPVARSSSSSASRPFGFYNSSAE